MTEVVDAHVVELGTGADGLRRPIDVGYVRALIVLSATTEGWGCHEGEITKTLPDYLKAKWHLVYNTVM